MKRAKKRNPIGTLLFLIPIIVVSGVVAYAVVTGAGSTNGTLVVEAQSMSKYFPAKALTVTASVGSHTSVTPYNLTLTQGAYTVTFAAIQWYTAPPPKAVDVIAGRASFAVGAYQPIIDAVSVRGDQFNVTSLGAMHGVTPVIWVNPTSDFVTISGSPLGRVSIAPTQNFTYIFQQPGTYGFEIVGSSSPNLVVKVS